MLDIKLKTIVYYVDEAKTEKKGEYSIISASQADASADRPYRMVIHGHSSHSNQKDILDTLHLSASSKEIKDVWIDKLKKISGTYEEIVVKEIVLDDVESHVTERTQLSSGNLRSSHSNIVLYMENVSLLSQMLGIYTTALLLVNLLPSSVTGPTTCADTFFIYQNPETGICVGTEIALVVVGIHLIIDITFAVIVSNEINFELTVVDLKVEAEDLYQASTEEGIFPFLGWQLVANTVPFVVVLLLCWLFSGVGNISGYVVDYLHLEPLTWGYCLFFYMLSPRMCLVNRGNNNNLIVAVGSSVLAAIVEQILYYFYPVTFSLWYVSLALAVVAQ